MQSLPASARAVIGSGSQSEPFRNWLRLPHYDTGIRYQDEAGGVPGVVIELGNIRRSERLGGICSAPGVPTPYVGIRNEKTSPRRPIPNACDASFRAVQSNKYQVDLIPAGFGFAHQVHPTAAGKSRLDRKTQPSIEIVRRSFQNVPSGGDGCGGRIQRIQTAGYGIGIQQPVAALEFQGSDERGLSGAVRACDYREGGPAALGGVRRQFANDLVVFSGRGARQPADLESSAIGALHHIETVAVEIEDRKPGPKRLGESFAGRRPHRMIEPRAAEIVDHGHA